MYMYTGSVMTITALLSTLNSCANPFIYFAFVGTPCCCIPGYRRCCRHRRRLRRRHHRGLSPPPPPQLKTTGAAVVCCLPSLEHQRNGSNNPGPVGVVPADGGLRPGVYRDDGSLGRVLEDEIADLVHPRAACNY